MMTTTATNRGLTTASACELPTQPATARSGSQARCHPPQLQASTGAGIEGLHSWLFCSEISKKIGSAASESPRAGVLGAVDGSQHTLGIVMA
jgi:hypothetical protein